MRTLRCYLPAVMCVLASATGWAQISGRPIGFEWRTTSADLQRTSWLRVDPHLSAQSVSTPAFTLQWRETLDNAVRASASLTQGITINGMYGFSTAGNVIGGASNNVFAVDTDTGFPYWRRHIDAPLQSPTPRCPGGITGAPARVVADLVPPPMQLPPRPPTGRGYRSAVGQPGEGVPMDLARLDGGAGLRAASAAPAPAAAPPTASAAPARGGPPAPGTRYAPIYVVSSAGMLHVLGPVSGIDVQRPAPFLPPNARYSDLAGFGGMLYTSTSEGCGGVANGVWAITLDEDKKVSSWPTHGGSPIGNVAFTSVGNIIVAIGAGTAGAGGFANAIVALDPKTLQPTDWFSSGKSDFATTPVVFRHNGVEIVAAATVDGRVFLLNADALGGADHSTPLFSSTSVGGAAAPEGLATFELDGARWLLVPTGGAIAAHKVVAGGDRLALQQGWTSRSLPASTAPIVVTDVVFAAASGRSQGSAVLFAFDARSGRDLWNSGTTIRSNIPRANVWASNSQVYVGTHDGTVYAFGFELERRNPSSASMR
jgi:outer membrane protein assembly factor BamB